MKTFLLFFNIVIMIPSASSADSCDYKRMNRILRGKPLSVSEPRSVWGNSDKILGLNGGSFEGFRFTHAEHPLVKARPGALAQIKPELIYILEDMNFYQMGFERFEHEFLRVRAKKATLSDYQEFYNSRLNLYYDGVHYFVEEISLLNQEFARQIQMHFLDHAGVRLGLKKSILNAGTVKEIETTVSKLYRWMSGSFAELYASVTLPNVQEMNVFLGREEPLRDLIDASLRKVFADFTSESEAISYFEERYPKVFRNRRIETLSDFQKKPARIVEELRRWIYDKEIDLIRVEGEKQIFVEVKYNRDPLTLDEFRAKNHGAQKSYEDQILEDKQLIEFLGLSDKIELEYLATGGMSLALKNELEKFGIKVLEAQ